MSEVDTPNYWDYLQLPKLLSLQGGLEGDEAGLMPDELHFIVVHQAFELWFKLMLSELRLARDHMAAPVVPEQRVPYVVHHLRRVNTILELCAAQFGVMETLSPQDFLAFRDKLIPSSGFQSFQMREIEILMGLGAEQRVGSGFGDPLAAIRRLGKGSEGGRIAIARVEAALAEQSLRAAVHQWLLRTPIHGSDGESAGDDAVVNGFLEDYLAAAAVRSEAQFKRLAEVGVVELEAGREKAASTAEDARAFLFAEDLVGDEDKPVTEAERTRTRRLRAAILFIESYRELPLLAWPRVLLDTIVELEQRMVLFRTRHARMVERIIGRRVGTGGSSGVDYLDRTTRYRVFTELWAVRSLLLPRSAVPPLEGAEAYGFAGTPSRQPSGG